MPKKRTKKQKQKVESKRKMEFVFSENSVAVLEAQEPEMIVQKATTTPSIEKKVKSSFGVETTKLLYQDLRKTGIVTTVVLSILFGMYLYIR